ncbi:MAG TPA: Uma2 family endonuclease [Candidatus Elarobacter sp.]|nr:Uma2 family endonuclease [Candidatus Elarobacter sp.]
MAKIIQREIVLPETKPETEWLRGRAVQKVSPKRKHAELQVWLGGRLRAWGRERGRVGSEWRFRVAPPGEDIRPLVPDLSFLAYERMRGTSDADWDAPLVAPDAAVEIRSPGDNRLDLQDKVATLLRAGARVVIVIDPRRRTVVTHDAVGRRTFWETDTFEHPALPGFSFSLAEMFAELDINPPG